MLKPWLSALRLTLEDPGSEGGGGGGGGDVDPQSPPIDEAPPRSAREAIYERIEGSQPDSAPAAEPKEEPATAPPQKTDTPPAPADSGTPPKQEGQPPSPEAIAAKRVADAQAALTRKSQEYSEAQKRIAVLEEKLSLVDEHIDWEKARQYREELAAKKADEPVLHREVKTLVEKELQARDDAKRAADEQNNVLAERSRRVDSLLSKHPHIKPYMDSGELFGVGDKLAMENPDKSWEEIGDMAAAHFKQREDALRERVRQELTTRREAIGAAGMPRAAGDMPGDSPGPAEVDTSVGAELADRRAALQRQRTLI